MPFIRIRLQQIKIRPKHYTYISSDLLAFDLNCDKSPGNFFCFSFFVFRQYKLHIIYKGNCIFANILNMLIVDIRYVITKKGYTYYQKRRTEKIRHRRHQDGIECENTVKFCKACWPCSRQLYYLIVCWRVVYFLSLVMSLKCAYTFFCV